MIDELELRYWTLGTWLACGGLAVAIVLGGGAVSYEVRCGDSLRLLTELDRHSIEGVITDCPYSSGGMMRADRQAPAHEKYIQSGSSNRTVGNFEGDSRDARSFAYWCALWYGECLRVTRPGGILLSFSDWRQLPATIDSIQAGGWVWRGLAPWNKTEAARPQRGRLRAQCEYIVFASNGAHAPWGDEAPCLPGFYTYRPPRDRLHITQKPVGLMRQLVQLVPPDGRVLDPFAGSGTTGIAALREGRRVLLFDISPENAELIRDRLAAEVAHSDVGTARSGQAALFGRAAP